MRKHLSSSLTRERVWDYGVGGGHETENRPRTEVSRQEVVGCANGEVSFPGKMGDVKQQKGGKSGRRTD